MCTKLAFWVKNLKKINVGYGFGELVHYDIDIRSHSELISSFNRLQTLAVLIQFGKITT